MKLYNEVCKLAEELEKGRLICIHSIQQVKEDPRYTGEGKKELIEELLKEYSKGVEKANNERISLIDEFIKDIKPERGNLQVKELNEVLTLIKGLNVPLSDNELLDVTRSFNDNFATMEILKREIEDNNIEYNLYPETFKNLENKKAIFEKIEGFEKKKEWQRQYFKDDINLTCIKYSLEELKDWEQELLNLSK